MQTIVIVELRLLQLLALTLRAIIKLMSMFKRLMLIVCYFGLIRCQSCRVTIKMLSSSTLTVGMNAKTFGRNVSNTTASSAAHRLKMCRARNQACSVGDPLFGNIFWILGIFGNLWKSFGTFESLESLESFESLESSELLGLFELFNC